MRHNPAAASRSTRPEPDRKPSPATAQPVSRANAWRSCFCPPSGSSTSSSRASATRVADALRLVGRVETLARGEPAQLVAIEVRRPAVGDDAALNRPDEGQQHRHRRLETAQGAGAPIPLQEPIDEGLEPIAQKTPRRGEAIRSELGDLATDGVVTAGAVVRVAGVQVVV